MNSIEEKTKDESIVMEKQYGSFKVMFVSVGEGKLVARVTDIAGSWRVEWDEDNEMYTFLRFATAVDDNEEYVRAVFTVYYAVTNIKLLDIDFLNDFADAVNALNERNMKNAKPVSEEDDAEELKNLRTKDELANTPEMKEFFENADKELGSDLEKELEKDSAS